MQNICITSEMFLKNQNYMVHKLSTKLYCKIYKVMHLNTQNVKYDYTMMGGRNLDQISKGHLLFTTIDKEPLMIVIRLHHI